jgi:transketolase C-terminal domain/subunit
MRKDFFDILLTLMDNPNIYVIFVGLGFPRYDEFKALYPDRTYNTEASEQTALDIAVGLAHEGKIPFVYTITPFFWRAAESIRLLAHDGYHVVMCGAGRDKDYTVDDGFTHDASDIKGLMDLLDITTYFPEDSDELPKILNAIIQGNRPYFLSLRR